jgi:hypothetical protein
MGSSAGRIGPRPPHGPLLHRAREGGWEAARGWGVEATADLEEAAAVEGASGFAGGGGGGAEGQLGSRLAQFEGVPSWEGCGGRGRWIGLRWDPPGVGGEKVKISHFK